MGQALARCAPALPDLELVGAVDQGDPLEPLLTRTDVVIDFSLHHAVPALATLCARHQIALISGTTGLDPTERATLESAASRIPVVWASNFSTGVNTLFWLTRQAARILGPDFDLEVLEMHHRLKRDAPSGTATTLAEILADVRQLNLEHAARHGRSGQVGERTPGEIGLHAIRGGDVVGDHTVIFAGAGERLELTHRAASRDTFAVGALRAARWIVNRPPGLYSMQDVLGLQ